VTQPLTVTDNRNHGADVREGGQIPGAVVARCRYIGMSLDLFDIIMTTTTTTRSAITVCPSARLHLAGAGLPGPAPPTPPRHQDDAHLVCDPPTRRSAAEVAAAGVSSLPLEVGPRNTARRSGERCKLPQWGLVRSPSRQTIWCILESKSAALVAAVFVDFFRTNLMFSA